MTLSKILEEKRTASKLIKEKYGFLKKVKPIGFINMQDEEKVKALTPALEVLPCNFIIAAEGDVNIKNIAFDNNFALDLEVGFDFIVCDDNFKVCQKSLTKGIVPIISETCELSETMEEFNPIDTTGNCYKYEGDTHYHIFYAIVKYLENYKFPFDNRTLVKNILELDI